MSTKPVEEEEEEQQEEQHHGSRSAYFAGLHAGMEGADSFSGSYRGVKPTPHGGTATVHPEDIIGGSDCWCGLTYGHDWPGKDGGAKHPRQEKTVSAVRNTEEPHLSDLGSKWDRRVSKFITDLVNQFGVRYRDIDGQHLMLYPLDDSRPKKISASRNPEQTLAYLEKWVHDHIAPNIQANQVAALAARFNDPTKKRRVRVSDQHAEAPQDAPVAPVKVAVAPVAAKAAVDRPVDDGAPAGYHQHYDTKANKPTNWWEADDRSGYLCKSCDYTVTGSLQHKAAHQRVHSMTVEERTAVSSVGAAAKDHAKQARRTKARNAIRFLMEEYDIEGPKQAASPREVARLQREIEKLNAKVAVLTHERDDLKAKMALAKEAFGL